MPDQVQASSLSLRVSALGDAFRENIALFVVVGVLLVVLGQTISRQSSLEKRVASSENKIERIESWMVASGEASARRHTETMASLSSLVASMNYITEYYRRAESERR